jgi:hypothetical protein
MNTNAAPGHRVFRIGASETALDAAYQEYTNHPGAKWLEGGEFVIVEYAIQETVGIKPGELIAQIIAALRTPHGGCTSNREAVALVAGKLGCGSNDVDHMRQELVPLDAIGYDVLTRLVAEKKLILQGPEPISTNGTSNGSH